MLRRLLLSLTQPSFFDFPQLYPTCSHELYKWKKNCNSKPISIRMINDCHVPSTSGMSYEILWICIMRIFSFYYKNSFDIFITILLNDVFLKSRLRFTVFSKEFTSRVIKSRRCFNGSGRKTRTLAEDVLLKVNLQSRRKTLIRTCLKMYISRRKHLTKPNLCPHIPRERKFAMYRGSRPPPTAPDRSRAPQ